MKCYAAPFTFVSDSTPSCYKDRSSIDVLIFTLFLAFLILSSLFWGTTSFQLTKAANDINWLLMRALVIKSFHKNSTGFEIISAFRRKQNQAGFIPPPPKQLRKKYTYPHLFVAAFWNIIKQNLLLAFVLITENEKGLYQVGNKSNALPDLLMKSLWCTKGLYSAP